MFSKMSNTVVYLMLFLKKTIYTLMNHLFAIQFCSLHVAEFLLGNLSKGRFLKPEKIRNHSNERKGKEKKKKRGEEKEEKRKKPWLHS